MRHLPESGNADQNRESEPRHPPDIKAHQERYCRVAVNLKVMPVRRRYPCRGQTGERTDDEPIKTPTAISEINSN